MSNPQLDPILKQVARSFYLSIRVLPKPMQNPVAIAYLLARAADSIADTNDIKLNDRQQFLQNMQEIIKQESIIEAQTLSISLQALITNSGELKLIVFLPLLLECFIDLNSDDKKLVTNVVGTLISGMLLDLSTFNKTNTITALETPHDLENYTYLVAGCVGEFWTQEAKIHLTSVKSWDISEQSKLGIEFGKALQLTNILRDIAKDARLGRCYLPQEALDELKLDTQLLLHKQNDENFRPIVFSSLQLALDYFKSAERYLISTPRTAIRLRLASIWPILIGLKTLELIANKKNFLDPEITIKVSRQWVYSMLVRSLLIVSSNTLLSRWIANIRVNIESKI